MGHRLGLWVQTLGSAHDLCDSWVGNTASRATCLHGWSEWCWLLPCHKKELSCSFEIFLFLRMMLLNNDLKMSLMSLSLFCFFGILSFFEILRKIWSCLFICELFVHLYVFFFKFLSLPFAQIWAFCYFASFPIYLNLNKYVS